MNINDTFKWVSVKDELPHHQAKVLASCKPDHGPRPTLMTVYFEELREEAYNDDGNYDWCDYKEDDTECETPYYPAGFYETADGAEEYFNISNREPVTHWMPLPRYEE